MESDPDAGGEARGSPLERALKTVRRSYVEEHGEQPPEEFMEDARTQLVRLLAQRGRDEHRDVYDALADE